MKEKVLVQKTVRGALESHVYLFDGRYIVEIIWDETVVRVSAPFMDEEEAVFEADTMRMEVFREKHGRNS